MPKGTEASALQVTRSSRASRISADSSAAWSVADEGVIERDPTASSNRGSGRGDARSQTDVLKACLNLDDGALSWVMSQILAQKGPVVQEAIGHEEETHPQESVRSRSKGITTWSSEDGSAGVVAKGDLPPQAVGGRKTRRRSLLAQIGKGQPGSPSPSSPAMAKISDVLRPVVDSFWFQTIIVFFVVVALFGGDLATLADLPDEPGLFILDLMMSLATVVFCIEMALNCLARMHVYPLSFFFVMDFIGTLSMAFEISFLLGNQADMQTVQDGFDAVLMRTARAAKIGARIGRLSKLMKYVSYRITNRHGFFIGDKPAEAKVLSTKLMLTLSTTVSMLILVLVFTFPLFTIGLYPQQDLSMKTWAEKLEDAFSETVAIQLNSQVSSTLFQEKVSRMIDFYSTVGYKPFRLEGFGEDVVLANSTMTVRGASLLVRSDPVRISHIFKISVESCLVQRAACQTDPLPSILFDFTSPQQIESAQDMALMCFIIALMMIVSLILSHTLDRLLVQPMDRMLYMVKSMAADLLKQFGLDDSPEEEAEPIAETALIEEIFKKFARLANLAAVRNELTEEEMAGMDNDARAVLLDVMHLQVNRDLSSLAAVANASEPCFANLPVNESVFSTFELDVLELPVEQNQQVVVHMFFDSFIGRSTGRILAQPETFHKFHSVVYSNYNSLPYHNYFHAVDVTYTVHRLMDINRTDAWLSNVEKYALLLAALCHDVGHQGKTNPFLVETQHQLARVYNDKSPLENMHAAKLFEIASNEDTDVFKRLDKDARKTARKVCIAAILHTDNAEHFEMVREVSKIYELTSDLCDGQAAQLDDLDMNYVEQALSKNSMFFMEVFLHFADVSNPLKPFKMCHAWAWRVLEEFFNQGDTEKELGLPVGMLNDRDKINRPGSQHGFINFMVAPFVLNTVKVFPSLHSVYTQMGENLEQWRHMWVAEVKPSEEEIAKKDADVQKIKDTALELRKRTMP